MTKRQQIMLALLKTKIRLDLITDLKVLDIIERHNGGVMLCRF
jgi:hypothetical protein